MMQRGLHQLVGADGYLTLGMSSVVIVATCGISWLWQLIRVLRLARLPFAAPAKAEVGVVLGFRLDEDRVCRNYAMRLERARALYFKGIIQRVLIVGGRISCGTMSEAEAGRVYLKARNMPDEAILMEEHSRHTLENLRHTRTIMKSHENRKFLLITSRYHLARAAALAEGLGLRPTLCPAEERLGDDLLTLFCLCREACFLHWYVVGRAWVQLTGTRRSLARIS
jgi:uncharacterized SAM-binding protein YcdF (DUF218 family)